MVAGRGTWQTNDIITATGLNSGWNASGILTGGVEGGSVEVLHANSNDVDNGETLSFTFSFVPTKIVVYSNCKATRTGSLEQGGSSGVCYVTISGEEGTAPTSDGIATGWQWSNQDSKTLAQANALTSYVVYCDTGIKVDGTAGAMKYAATWTTSTKVLLLTATCTNCAGTSDTASVTCVAYK